MKVILQKDVPRIGQHHDVVEVSDGYASNFLIPRRLAVAATEQAVRDADAKRAGADTKREEEKARQKEALAKLDKATITITAKANEKGSLFKGITAAAIAAAIAEQTGEAVDASMITLDQPFKEVGVFDVMLEQGGETAVVSVTITALE